MLNKADVNKVLLVGYIKYEPQWRTVDSADVMCFTIVTPEVKKKNGSSYKLLEYHYIQMPAEYLGDELKLNEGDFVYVQGEIKTCKVMEYEKVIETQVILATSVEQLKAGSK